MVRTNDGVKQVRVPTNDVDQNAPNEGLFEVAISPGVRASVVSGPYLPQHRDPPQTPKRDFPVQGLRKGQWAAKGKREVLGHT